MVRAIIIIIIIIGGGGGGGRNQYQYVHWDELANSLPPSTLYSLQLANYLTTQRGANSSVAKIFRH